MKIILLNRITLFIIIGFVLLSCNDEDVTPPDETEIFLHELMDIMEAKHIYKNEIDWTEFRERVIDTARSIESRYKKLTGIRQALTLLGDNHSYVIASNGQYIGRFNPRLCESETNFFLPKPDNIGYVRVTGFTGTEEAGIAFAEAIQNEIKEQDSETIKGWIVDLRRNTGGNMYPMLAGIGPILGRGIAGYFLYYNNTKHSFSYKDGGAYFNDNALLQVDDPYELLQPNPKVAVLLDDACASSGEAIASAFSGRENTRSFGTPTCGISTGIVGYELSDRSTLGLAISIFADRNLQIFGGPIPPDEMTDPESTLQVAADWIESE